MLLPLGDCGLTFALASATTVDLYRHLVRRDADDARCLVASRWFTVLWGLAAIGVALTINLAENLVQYANMIASIFYPGMLGLFLVAFFLKRVGGTAVFVAGLASLLVTTGLFFARWAHPDFPISYLWDNLIGCAACVVISLVIQAFLPANRAENGTSG